MKDNYNFTYSLLRFAPKRVGAAVDGNCFAVVRYLAKRHTGSTVVLVSSLNLFIPLHAQLFVPTKTGFTTYEFRPKAGFVVTKNVPPDALQTQPRTISADQIDHYMSALQIAYVWIRGKIYPRGIACSGGDKRVVHAAYHIT